MKNHIKFTFLLTCILFCSNSIHAQIIEPIFQMGHIGEVRSVKFSKDNKFLLTSGDDGNIVVWDVQSHSQINTIYGVNVVISCFEYNQEHKIMVIGTYNNQALIYDFNKSSPLIRTLIFKQYITSALISSDASKILIGSNDYSIALMDNNIEYRYISDGDISGIALSQDNNIFYFGTYAKNIFKFEIEDFKAGEEAELIFRAESIISDIALSENEENLVFAATGDYNSGGQLGVLDLKSNSLINSIYDFFTPFGVSPQSICFFNEKTIIYQDKNNKISVWNFINGEKRVLIDVKISQGFDLSENKEYLSYTVENEIFVAKILNPNQKIGFNGSAENPIRIIAQKGPLLYVEYPSGIKKIDLKELKVSMFKEKLYDNEWEYFSIDKELNYFIEDGVIKSLKDDSILSNLYLKTKYFIDDFSILNQCTFKSKLSNISDNGDFYLYLTESNHLMIYKIDQVIKDKEEDRIFNYFEEDSMLFNQSKINDYLDGAVSYDVFFDFNNPQKIVFHPYKNKALLLYEDGFDFFDMEKENYKRENKEKRTSYKSLPGIFDPIQKTVLVASSYSITDTIAYEGNPKYGKEWKSKVQNGDTIEYLNSINGIALIYEEDGLKENGYLKRDSWVHENAEICAMEFDGVNKRILVAYTDGTLNLLKTTPSGYVLYKSAKLSSKIIDMKVSDDGRYIFVINNIGALTIFDNNKLSVVLSVITSKDEDYIFIDNNCNYKRSKNAQNLVVFKKGDDNFKISQIDDLYNQPHIIMKTLGYESLEKINILEQLASTSKTAITALNCPILSVLNQESLEYITTSERFTFKTFCKSTDQVIDYAQLWINGVPQYDKGNEPSANLQNEWTHDWDIALRNGTNTIRLVAFDKNGIGSKELIFTINCKKPYKKPNLYIGLISVSNYKDSNMNLQYAVKDGADLTNVFVDYEGNKRIGFPSRFGKIYVDSFFNEKATKTSILEWRKRLLNSNPDDYVLLFVSGHGLIDSNLFYFATHDIDFRNPQEKGMTFDELEGLIVEIPAQQKLFLMDACHSGELLDGNVEVNIKHLLPEGNEAVIKGAKQRGASSKQIGNSEGFINLEELKQEFFSNYNSRSGATVISAAAGSGFALESDQWNNGIFTYSVISGLIYRLADSNKDGEVSVVELSRYVTKEVKKKTEGAQIPNDRQENIENNFRVW